jgi:hypothetical protein
VTGPTEPDKGRGTRNWQPRSRLGLIRGVSSCYRFSGPFVVRLMGVGLVAVGLLVLVVAGLVAVFSLPGVVLLVGAVGAVLALLLLGVAARRRVVVRFDDTGYRVRSVRGAGVRQNGWTQVEDVAATTVAGERCVVIRLRDGRTTTVPVGVLAGRPDAFVDDLRGHLNRGHGYRPVPGPRG